MAVFKQDRQDRDYYALQELLKPKEEAEKSSGIGTKPDNQEQDDEGLFSGFFGGLFDRSRQQAQELSVLAEEEAIRSALEIRLMRQAAGITSSKAPTGPLSDTARDAMFSSSDMRGTEVTMKDNAREAQEVFQPTITPVSRGEQPEMADSPAPVDAPSVDARSNEMLDKPKGIMSKDIEDVLKTVLDSDANDSTDSADGGAAPSDGKEIETGEAGDTFASLIINGNIEDIASSTHLNNTFNGFEDVEGDTNHVDGRGYFTMPFGVVPDKNSVKKADGTTFDPKAAHGYTTETSGTVDTSNATHTVKVGKNNTYVVKRVDYDSDEAFAKGVLSLYNREASKKYGSGWDELTDKAKEMALDMAWNGGIGAVGWSSVKKALKEAGKEEPNTENLFAFTVNFRSDTKYPRGLFKRRLIQYNKIANDSDIASTYSTEAVMDKGKRVGTKYIAERPDGTVIGSWTYTDKADDPSTKDKNEVRTPSAEKIESNVLVGA